MTAFILGVKGKIKKGINQANKNRLGKEAMTFGDQNFFRANSARL